MLVEERHIIRDTEALIAVSYWEAPAFLIGARRNTLIEGV